jgi:hypothetical protein
MTRCVAANSLYDEEGRGLGERAKEAANPVSIELNRWKRLAAVTKRDLEGMPELSSTQKPVREFPKPYVTPGGLVNFPKYMLFEKCHLRQMDLQRFIEDSNKLREAAEEPLDGKAESPASPGTPASPSIYQTISWGAPRLRTGGPVKAQWAGSACPAGKAQRSSNPFRQG